MKFPFLRQRIQPQKIEEKKIDTVPDKPASSQTRNILDHPFQSSFNSYQPLTRNIGVLRNLREAIPLLNAGLNIRKLLMGTFTVDTFGNKALLESFEYFNNKIRVNWTSQGFSSWWGDMFGSADETGMGVGEIVLAENLKDIYHLKNCKTEDFAYVKDEVTGGYVLGVRENLTNKIKILERPELVPVVTLDTRDGDPYGVPVLWGLPFVGQVFLRIEKAWENAAWRWAEPSMAVIVTGGEDQKGETGAKTTNAIAMSIAGQIKEVMQKKRIGQTGDIFGGVPYGGKVDIKLLGGGDTIDVMEIPSKTMAEQLIAVTGIPPHLLGLSWSTTERMSSEQNDILVSRVNKYRERITPILEKVYDTWLLVTGNGAAKYKIVWDEDVFNGRSENGSIGKIECRC